MAGTCSALRSVIAWYAPLLTFTRTAAANVPLPFPQRTIHCRSRSAGALDHLTPYSLCSFFSSTSSAVPSHAIPYPVSLLSVSLCLWTCIDIRAFPWLDDSSKRVSRQRRRGFPCTARAHASRNPGQEPPAAPFLCIQWRSPASSSPPFKPQNVCLPCRPFTERQGDGNQDCQLNESSLWADLWHVY